MKTAGLIRTTANNADTDLIAIGAGVVFAAGFGGGNQIYLVVKPLDCTPIDGILYNTPIEIRVYN